MIKSVQTLPRIGMINNTLTSTSRNTSIYIDKSINLTQIITDLYNYHHSQTKLQTTGIKSNRKIQPIVEHRYTNYIY